MSKTISAGRTPRITIEEVSGDLSLVGWEGEDVLIKGDEQEVRVQQDGDQVRLSASDDLALRVPRASSVFIETVNGDAAIRGVTGALELKETHGDLSIRDVSSVTIGTVHSDLSLRGAKGNVGVKNVHSDANIRDVEGDLNLASVADDLVLREARGNVTANVGEDVVMYLNPRAGNTYEITAGDDILLILPPKADATLTLRGDEINVDWPGIEKDDGATERVITLGNGAARLNLNAGGDIRVTSQIEAGETADEFGNFAGINLDWSGFGERISRKVEQATRKAEAAARRAEQKMRDAERRSRRFEGGFEIGRWNWDFGSKGASGARKESVSDEERMAILKMLQEKKITAEQAEQLLSSLEGGS
jgi:hypothetical protein